MKRHGKVDYPVETDDLTVLIEMHDADLDPYAYERDVEGVTEFFPDRGPKVSISERIAADERRENRFRTTLTHEFGHVKFHGPLWAQKFANGDLLERGVNANKAISTTSWTPRSPTGWNGRPAISAARCLCRPRRSVASFPTTAARASCMAIFMFRRNMPRG